MLHRLEAAGFSFQRNNLVAKFAVARLFGLQTCVGVFPVKLLDRKLCCLLSLFYLAAFEYSMAGKHSLFSFVIDSVDGKAHASVGTLAIAPGNRGDVIVREGNSVLHDKALRVSLGKFRYVWPCGSRTRTRGTT